MNQIMRDSDEWRTVQTTLKELSSAHASIKSEVQAARREIAIISDTQKENHRVNQADIQELKIVLNGKPGDVDNIGFIRTFEQAYTKMVTFAETAERIAKAILALLTLLCLGLGVYYASLEYRNKTSLIVIPNKPHIMDGIPVYADYQDSGIPSDEILRK